MIGGPYVATVAFRADKNCLISVPQQFLPLNRTQQILSFKVQYNGNRCAYFSWSGEVSSSSSDCTGRNLTIEINGLYALKLGLYESEQVVVTGVNDVTPLESLTAEPLAVDDWEILELHTDYVQNNLLDQVRVVWNSQILPVWVHRNVCIFVRIGNLVPDCNVGFLEQFTEVHVSPKTRHFEAASHSSQANSRENPVADANENGGTEAENKQASGDDKKPSTFSIFSVYKLFQNNFEHWFSTSSDTENTIAQSQETANYEEFSRSQLTGFENVEVSLRMQSTERIRDVLSEPCPCLQRFLSFSSDFNGHLFAQPTSVFVLFASLQFEIDICQFRRSVALAKISKVFSTSEIAEKLETQSRSTSKQKQSRDNDKKSLKEFELLKPPSFYGKVVIVDVLLSQFEGLCCNESCFASRMVRHMVPGAVYISDTLRRQLGCSETSKVHLNFGVPSSRTPNSIRLCPIRKMAAEVSNASVEIALTRWIRSSCSPACPLVLRNGSLIELAVSTGRNVDFVLETATGHGDQCPLFLTPSVKVSVQLETVKNVSFVLLADAPIIGSKSAVLGGFDDLISRGLVFLMAILGFGQLSRSLRKDYVATCTGGALLVCGPPGSGKTTLAQTLCRELADTVWRVHSATVSCKALKGKRVESVDRILKKTYEEALYRAPSVVLLDDLDQLACSPAGPEQEVGGVAVYHTRMANALLDILKTVTAVSRNSPVVTIATCSSRGSLHPMLSSSRGVHLFQDILEIKNPSLEQRDAMLQRITLCKTMVLPETLQKVDWQSLGAQTEGFVVRDLETVVDRAIHTAAAGNSSSSDAELLLSDEHFAVALRDFVPSSLRGLQLKSTWTNSWHDIGGLHDVKRVLIETLQWPVKYPKLFAQCPLPMRSGLLLYGPPGTGKTLLASVVAKECNMNFFSIKGPELLSKYIGASEQSVRDLFQRAANAKPSIIFFDEFDSLASKRGHDSTGVTDRVVNQLLTQLDGVEGRQGVYVLAATSRPDLIDPALLRPGRLDKCICCPLPSLEDRTEILESLIRTMNLSPDVRLTEIAAQCVHFSGADLQGLLCNAQLKAIHRIYPFVNETSVRAKTSSSRLSSDEFCHLSNESISSSSDSCDGVYDVAISTVEDVAIFIPSLEVGPVSLNDETTRERVKQQIRIISANICNSVASMPTKEVSESSNVKSILVSTEDILEALREMKPSVNRTERQRYEAIYENFVKSRGDHFGLEVATGDKRATLA